MGRGIDNYFIILELDFSKPESDIQFIEQRIKEKAKFWNDNSDKGRKQQKYRQYKSQVMDIGKVMKTDSLRNAEAKEALTFVQDILKEELKFFAGQKEIEEPAANTIMEKSGLWTDMFVKLTGLKIVKETQTAASEIVDPNPKPDKIVKFKKYDTDLSVLHKSNLYDFLADDAAADIIGLQTLDGEELIKSYSDDLKKKVKYDKTEEGTATRTLCAACEEVFDPKNSELRSNYDKYLIWQKKDAVINRMDKYSGANKVLDEQKQRLFTDELTQILRSREDAITVFHQICAYKGIKLSGGTMQKEGSEKLLACGHCYSMVDISNKKTRKCSVCGKDLYIHCPKCKDEVPASSKACGNCGFLLEDLQKVEVLCETSKTAIANMDFDKARSNLARADQLLSGYDRIDILKKELSAQESVFSKEVDQLNELVSKKHFYKAAEVLRNLQRKAPTAKIYNDVLIESSVKEAERLYKLAVSETLEEKLISICSQISSVCADYPGVEALLVKYRPQPPANVKIICDNNTCTNTITWDKSASAGDISYKVLRKENTAAASIDDPAAEEIGMAGIAKFVDAKLKPGINYYYSVYAIRAGVASNAACGNAINYAQVNVIMEEEGDGFIRVEWKPLEKNVQVAVFRGENGDYVSTENGERIGVSNNYFLDDAIENEKKYFYLIVATYHVEGKDFLSKKVVGPLIATSLPDPVEDLEVYSIEDDMFEARWTYSGKEKVLLYCTDKRSSLKYGDITDVNKVTELLKPIDSISYKPGICRFRIRDNKKYAIIPVTIKHNTAVVGEQAVAAKIEKISVHKMELINSDLRINIKWPEEAVSILMVYGSDTYARSLEDRKGKTIRSISKKQFESDMGLYLRNIEKKDYYITMYSACKLNGEMVYSEGTQVFFSNKPKAGIQYSIRIRGLINKQVEIEFTSSEAAFYLPEIDLVSKQDGVPVYSSSGTVIEHIEEQNVEGSYKITFPADSVPKNSYMKAFFTDLDVNDEVSLRPVYGTNFKIN